MMTDFFDRLHELYKQGTEEEQSIIEQISEAALFYLDFRNDYDEIYCMMIDKAIHGDIVVNEII